MKHLLIQLSVFFICMLICYFLAAFIAADINFTKWDVLGRFLYITIGGFLSIGLADIITNEID